MSTRDSYWNTTRLTGAELREAVQSATKQDAAVLAIFDSCPGQVLSPSQVWRIGCGLGLRWLLTSVRRSINTLTETRELAKLSDRIEGIHGRMEYTWRRLPQGMRDALAALHGEHKPLPPDELSAFESSKAAEMHRAEARRNPSPQADMLLGQHFSLSANVQRLNNLWRKLEQGG